MSKQILSEISVLDPQPTEFFEQSNI